MPRSTKRPRWQPKIQLLADPKQPAALVNARTKPISRELAKLTKQLRKYSSTEGVEGVGEAGDEGAKEEEEGNLVKGPVEQ